jgi:hypothetical protein
MECGARQSSRHRDTVAMVTADIGNRFDLSNADVVQFLRTYDFAWARRQLIFDVEAFRGAILRA